MTKTIELTEQEAQWIMDMIDNQIEIEKSNSYLAEPGKLDHLIRLCNRIFDTFEEKGDYSTEDQCKQAEIERAAIDELLERFESQK